MTTVDLTEIEAEWLRLCGACDAGFGLCTCSNADPRPTIQRLADEVLRLRIQIATAEDERATKWALPAEPGPEVTAMRDARGNRWHRIRLSGNGWTPEDRNLSYSWVTWGQLLTEHGPLTDATGEQS